MKLPPRQQPAWSHDLSFIWMLQLTFLFVAHRVVETIVVYISITVFLGSEAHVAIHQGRWGLSFFEQLAIIAFFFTLLALVTTVGVIQSREKKLVIASWAALVVSGALCIAVPLLYQRNQLEASRRQLMEYQDMLQQGIDDSYAKESVIEYSANLEIILGEDQND